jgi:hypothetical protein
MIRPSNERELLAVTIAQAFNEPERVKLYHIYCRKYPLAVIHRAFAEARSLPQTSIKKSRAAVFFYLAKRYAHEAP